jgi:hypothetical protein
MSRHALFELLLFLHVLGAVTAVGEGGESSLFVARDPSMDALA